VLAVNRFLRPSLYAALVGRDLVVLDIRSGCYELLAGAGQDLAIDPSGRYLQISDPDLDAALMEADLFVSETKFQPSPRLPLLPTRSIIGGDRQLRWRERFHFAAAWSEMLFHYYGRDLPALLRRVRPRSTTTRLGTDDVERLGQLFHQLSPWAPFAGDCVFRCFMLLRALQAAGVCDVRWVFGVRTWPFYAHCWLQKDEVTLTDHADTLVSFVPIFAT
jgi:hypothetical protein